MPYHDPYHDIDDVMIKPRVAIGIQGGGSHAIGSGIAAVIAAQEIINAGGSVNSISGTSGGAADAVLLGKAINEGLPPQEFGKYFEDFWFGRVASLGQVTGFSKARNPHTTTDDCWPNIPRSYLALSGLFNWGQPGLTTTIIKDMVDASMGDWTAVRNGPTKVYVNSEQMNLFNGQRRKKVYTGEQLDADTVAASAGLKEIGGHYMLRELMSPFNWMRLDINQYLDGAYGKFDANPSITPMLDNDPTDVIIISLHAPSAAPKTGRSRHLYTEEVHHDLTDLQLDDGRRFHLHEIALRLPETWTESSRLNPDPEFLHEIVKRCTHQARHQLQHIMAELGRNSTYRPHSVVVEKLLHERQLAVA